MRINTITCHDVYNYGASLQAYALQKFLEDEGHQVRIIDYKPEYLDHYYKFWHIPEYSSLYKLSQKNFLLHLICAIRCVPVNFGTWRRKHPFDEFTSNELSLTRKYRSYDELNGCPPDGDAYISGSDQIWNCNMENGKDPAFFLQFGDKSIKRISYAASFAIPFLPNEMKPVVKKYLHSYDSISVREKTGVSILKDLGVEGVNVLDPVFLLSSLEWKKIVKRKTTTNKPYLLVYNLSRDTKGFDKAVKTISMSQGLQVVSIDAYRKYPYSDRCIVDAGPREFVSLISNADYVVADSFHAMAFCLIFNKPFSIYYSYENVSRMKDLLSIVGLESRLNPEQDLLGPIDWESVNSSMNYEVQFSKVFLRRALGYE